MEQQLGNVSGAGGGMRHHETLRLEDMLSSFGLYSPQICYLDPQPREEHHRRFLCLAIAESFTPGICARVEVKKRLTYSITCSSVIFSLFCGNSIFI